MAVGYRIVRSPYTPYSIYLRGTLPVTVASSECVFCASRMCLRLYPLAMKLKRSWCSL